MRIENTGISGLYVVKGLHFSDNRGQVIKPFSMSFFEESVDLNLQFKETWFTRSHKNVIRAMHLQVGEFACEKLVSVIRGSVLDVILDIRKESPTYGKWLEFPLSDRSATALYIPKGCAHGYKVLEDDTVTMYMATEIHFAKDDVGILWNSFGYDWQIDDPVISEKDKNLPPFQNPA